MARDAYFSFGEEELDAPLAVAGPDSVRDSSGPGLRGPFRGERPKGPERSHRLTGRLRASTTPRCAATLLALILAVVLLRYGLARVIEDGSAGSDGEPGPASVAGRTEAHVLAPVRPGIVAGAEDRPRRQKVEQGRAQRRRSQTRRRARRHRDRRQIERRDLSARHVRPPADKATPEPADEAAPPATQATEASAAAQAPPAYAPPPEAAPEPAPEPAPPGPPHIRDGAHSQEFGL